MPKWNFIFFALLSFFAQAQTAPAGFSKNLCSDLFQQITVSEQKILDDFFETAPYKTSLDEFQNYLDKVTSRPINEDTRFKIAQTWKNASRQSNQNDDLKPSELQSLIVQSMIQIYKTWHTHHGTTNQGTLHFHTNYLMYHILTTIHGFQFWKNRTSPILSDHQILLQKIRFLNSLKLDLAKEYQRVLPQLDLDTRMISFLLRNSEEQFHSFIENLTKVEPQKRQIKVILFGKNKSIHRHLTSHELDLRFLILENGANSSAIFLKEYELKMLAIMISEMTMPLKDAEIIHLATAIQNMIYLRIIRHVRYQAPPRPQDEVVELLNRLEALLVSMRDQLKKPSTELDQILEKTIGSRIYYRGRKNMHLENKAAIVRFLQQNYQSNPQQFMSNLGKQILSFNYIFSGHDKTVETNYSILTTPRDFQNFMSVVTNVEHQSQLALGFLLGHQQHNFKELGAYWFFQFYHLVLSMSVRSSLIESFLSTKPLSTFSGGDFEILFKHHEVQNNPSLRGILENKKRQLNESSEGDKYL